MLSNSDIGLWYDNTDLKEAWIYVQNFFKTIVFVVTPGKQSLMFVSDAELKDIFIKW